MTQKDASTRERAPQTNPKDIPTDAKRKERTAEGDERQVEDAREDGRIHGAW